MAEDRKKHKISKRRASEFRGKMLDWYAKHKRPIPWRVRDGETPNPYHIWLSEIMCQQTTVQAVIPYFLKFTATWPHIEDLANAEKEDVMDAWAGLGYYARARNLHQCAQVIVEEYGGQFPADKATLLKLPGIGDYTSAAIMTMAFNVPATVVDGNVERVMARIFNIQKPLPKSKPVLKQAASLFFTTDMASPGDFAQSLMDLGAMICTPKSPKCMLCPVWEYCKAYKAGSPELLPRKERKKPKPKKHGYVYWISNAHGDVLLHRRNEAEMLGGMIGLPSSPWLGMPHKIEDAFDSESFQDLYIEHSFTHFDLRLVLRRAHDNQGQWPSEYRWINRKKLEDIRLPTVFQKALNLFLKHG